MLISISIVSHGQFNLVQNLLADLKNYCADQTPQKLEIILTLNIPEKIPQDFIKDISRHFPVKIIRNKIPKGFGANHNTAFEHSSGEYFCVLNPDIRLTQNIFLELIKHNTGVSAPQITDENGHIQDNAREFLTPLKLILRLIGRIFKKLIKPKIKNNNPHPDWVAGMFMVFPREIFKKLHGFDERYYLYCEDMDICRRLKKQGYTVTLNTHIQAIHMARRDSHKKLKYLLWHLKSLWIFFWSS